MSLRFAQNEPAFWNSHPCFVPRLWFLVSPSIKQNHLVWSTCVDSLRRFRESFEANLWTDWSVPLDLTSCRGLVIETASARRCDNEGSPCKRWGLGVSVESKERFGTIKGAFLHYQGRAPANPLLWSFIIYNKEWSCPFLPILLPFSTFFTFPRKKFV